jgi:hypothetical protein
MYRAIPEWIRRRDFELFTVLLCFTAGIPLVTTRRVEATSLEAQLPFEVVMAWSLVLVIAPLLVFTGAALAHKKTGLESFKWVRWEVFGLRLLSYAAYLYASVIAINSLTTKDIVSPAVTMIVILGMTCTSRAWGMLEQIDEFWDRLGVRR